MNKTVYILFIAVILVLIGSQNILHHTTKKEIELGSSEAKELYNSYERELTERLFSEDYSLQISESFIKGDKKLKNDTIVYKQADDVISETISDKGTYRFKCVDHLATRTAMTGNIDTFEDSDVEDIVRSALAYAENFDYIKESIDSAYIYSDEIRFYLNANSYEKLLNNKFISEGYITETAIIDPLYSDMELTFKIRDKKLHSISLNAVGSIDGDSYTYNLFYNFFSDGSIINIKNSGGNLHEEQEKRRISNPDAWRF